MTKSEKPCCGAGKSDDTIKKYVREKYGQIAKNASGCKPVSCCDKDTSKDAITRDLYSESETSGIPVEALLASMGCANPLAIAELKPGETVLDLGSGGGIDVLLSAKRVGPTGKAIGLDMTDEMLTLARKNQKESGIENVEFLKGEIENIPLPNNSVDVIISNCVVNLSPDKDKVLKEAFRVLKPGGRFSIADIVLTKPVTGQIKQNLELWSGCVAGALTINEYREKLVSAGFTKPEVEIFRTYSLDDASGLASDELIREIGVETITELMSSFVSAFVKAKKP